MGKKEQKEINNNNKTKVEAVLELLKKQTPLTVKQEKYCNIACVERFLKMKGESVKKASKQLRACLSWRDNIGTENLIADEFSAELAEGVAYVSGHDEESRPVVIFRMKQDYQKFHSQKLFIRLLVFTLEVAIGTMPKNVEQFVLLFDASFFRSGSAFMNMFVAALKVVAEYYPARLHRAFIIDPPSLFSYIWKGVRPFVELSSITSVVSSLDFEDSLDFDGFSGYVPSRVSSLRFDSASIKSGSSSKVGACASSRFSFTVSHRFDSLKPWYLSVGGDGSGSRVGPTNSSLAEGPALISPLNARSFSFASPMARTPPVMAGMSRKSLFPSTPMPERRSSLGGVGDPRRTAQQKASRPSFMQSPATFFRRECHISKTDKWRESFVPFLKFYRRPYDEMIYRSKMRPPLGGLISIVSPHIRRRHMSVSQRF